jgi:hypothetical protein
MAQVSLTPPCSSQKSVSIQFRSGSYSPTVEAWRTEAKAKFTMSVETMETHLEGPLLTLHDAALYETSGLISL